MRGERVVHVVPVLVVVFQKALEIRLVLDADPADVVSAELFAERVDLLAARRDGGFDPFHIVSPPAAIITP